MYKYLRLVWESTRPSAPTQRMNMKMRRLLFHKSWSAWCSICPKSLSKRLAVCRSKLHCVCWCNRCCSCTRGSDRDRFLLPAFITDNIWVRAYLIQDGHSEHDQRRWSGVRQRLCGGRPKCASHRAKLPLDVKSEGFKVRHPPYLRLPSSCIGSQDDQAVRGMAVRVLKALRPRNSQGCHVSL